MQYPSLPHHPIGVHPLALIISSARLVWVCSKLVIEPRMTIIITIWMLLVKVTFNQQVAHAHALFYMSES